jgi:hypothetical protein
MGGTIHHLRSSWLEARSVGPTRLGDEKRPFTEKNNVLYPKCHQRTTRFRKTGAPGRPRVAALPIRRVRPVLLRCFGKAVAERLRARLAEWARKDPPPSQQSMKCCRSCARRSVVLVSARDHQAMLAHCPPKTRGGIEQIPNPVGMNQSFGKRPRPAPLAPLARADQADQPHLIDPKTWAMRLMVTNPAPRMLLKPSDERRKAADGVFSLRAVELSGKLRGNHGHVTAAVLPNPQGPAAKRPDDQCFRRLKFRHGCRPRRRCAMCGWIGQDQPPLPGALLYCE